MAVALESPPQTRLDAVDGPFSLFLCVSHGKLSGDDGKRVHAEESTLWIGPRNTLPHCPSLPFYIGVVVDGFLSFEEAMVMCRYVKQGRSGTREFASAAIKMCERMEVYKCTADFNVLLGLMTSSYRVQLIDGRIHLAGLSSA